MKTPDRFNKPYFYTYLLLVLAIVSLTTLVLALVFDRPGLAFLLSILLGLLALSPLGSALDRLVSAWVGWKSTSHPRWKPSATSGIHSSVCCASSTGWDP